MIEGSFAPDIRWLFTDRRGGHSEPPYDELNLATHVGDDESVVAMNRAVATRRLVGDPRDSAARMPRMVAVRAVHGAAVGVVDERTDADVESVDALVSRTPDIALLVIAADCVPIVMADPVAGVIACVHAGWRGLVAGVASAAVGAMCDQGARPDRIECVLGPSICGRCYVVDRQRYDEVAAVAPTAASMSLERALTIDIRQGLRTQLFDSGVRVSVVGSCTRESPEYFSYRRDGVTGRQGALIVRTATTGGAR